MSIGTLSLGLAIGALTTIAAMWIGLQLPRVRRQLTAWLLEEAGGRERAARQQAAVVEHRRIDRLEHLIIELHDKLTAKPIPPPIRVPVPRDMTPPPAPIRRSIPNTISPENDKDYTTVQRPPRRPRWLEEEGDQPSSTVQRVWFVAEDPSDRETVTYLRQDDDEPFSYGSLESEGDGSWDEVPPVTGELAEVDEMDDVTEISNPLRPVTDRRDLLDPRRPVKRRAQYGDVTGPSGRVRRSIPPMLQDPGRKPE